MSGCDAPDADRVAGIVQPADRHASDPAYPRGGSFARTAGFAVSLIRGGTSTGARAVSCDQPPDPRYACAEGRKIESLPDAIMDEDLARLAKILE